MFKNPSMRREFVLVSGDRGKCPALEINHLRGRVFTTGARVGVEGDYVKCYKDLLRSWKPVTLRYLSHYLDCIREKEKKTSEEENIRDDGF